MDPFSVHLSKKCLLFLCLSSLQLWCVLLTAGPPTPLARRRGSGGTTLLWLWPWATPWPLEVALHGSGASVVPGLIHVHNPSNSLPPCFHFYISRVSADVGGVFYVLLPMFGSTCEDCYGWMSLRGSLSASCFSSWRDPKATGRNNEARRGDGRDFARFVLLPSVYIRTSSLEKHRKLVQNVPPLFQTFYSFFYVFFIFLTSLIFITFKACNDTAVI